MRNHLLSYDVLILLASFHDVWVECNRSLYWHRQTRYEWWCLLSGTVEVHVTLMTWDYPACRVWVSLYLLVFKLVLPIYGPSRVQFPRTLAFFKSLWPVIPHLLGVRETLDFIMFTWSMSVKVKVAKEWMRPATNDAHNEMNDIKGFTIGWLRAELDLCNDTR